MKSNEMKWNEMKWNENIGRLLWIICDSTTEILF